MYWPWTQLGIEPTQDLSLIKHAYAAQLKTAHPEDKPEEFQKLHTAYQAAVKYARRQGQSIAVKPEIAKPQTVKPETPKPQTVKPETPKPETPKPETAKPETALTAQWDYDALIGTDSAYTQPSAMPDAPSSGALDDTAVTHALQAFYKASNPFIALFGWHRFFRSKAFLQVKNNLQFIWRLEHRLSKMHTIPYALQRELCAAYRLDNPAPAYIGLYHLVNPAQHQKNKRAQRLIVLWIIFFLALQCIVFWRVSLDEDSKVNQENPLPSATADAANSAAQQPYTLTKADAVENLLKKAFDTEFTAVAFDTEDENRFVLTPSTQPELYFMANLVPAADGTIESCQSNYLDMVYYQALCTFADKHQLTLDSTDAVYTELEGTPICVGAPTSCTLTLNRENYTKDIVFLDAQLHTIKHMHGFAENAPEMVLHLVLEDQTLYSFSFASGEAFPLQTLYSYP